MPFVKVTITTPDKKDATFSAMLERQLPGSDVWNRVEGKDIPANLGDVDFELKPGQRLVITPIGKVEQAVYDKEQRASILPSQQKNSENAADKPVNKPEEPIQNAQPKAIPSTLRDDSKSGVPSQNNKPADATSSSGTTDTKNSGQTPGAGTLKPGEGKK